MCNCNCYIVVIVKDCQLRSDAVNKQNKLMGVLSTTKFAGPKASTKHEVTPFRTCILKVLSNRFVQIS